MQAHYHLRARIQMRQQGSSPAIATIGHRDVAGLWGKMIQPFAHVVIGEQDVVDAAAEQVIAEMQATALPRALPGAQMGGIYEVNAASKASRQAEDGLWGSRSEQCLNQPEEKGRWPGGFA